MIHPVYDTGSKLITDTESFIPQIPFESAFTHFQDFGYSVDRSGQYTHITDLASFQAAQRLYLDQQKKVLLLNPQVRQLIQTQGLSETQISRLEARVASYYEVSELASKEFTRLDLARNSQTDYILS